MPVGRGEHDRQVTSGGDEGSERGVVDAPPGGVDERRSEPGQGLGDAAAGEVEGDAELELRRPPRGHRGGPAEDHVLLEAPPIEAVAELEDEPLAAADPQTGEEVDDTPWGHRRTVPPGR